MLAVCCEQRFTIRSPSDDEARHPGCYAVAGGTDGYAATSPVVPVTLNELLQPLDDTTTVRVRNFWATWCKPCIEEMPVFAALARSMQAVRIELISVDAPTDSAKVRAFWQRRGFPGVHVYHIRQRLTTIDIDTLAPNWSGAIPMTIVERGARRIIHEGELDAATLHQLVGMVMQPSR